MTVIELITDSPARRRASIKPGLVKPIGRPARLSAIALQSKQAISRSINDLPCGRRLAPHRIQRRDAVLDRQLVEKRRNSGDVVQFAINAALTKDKALLACPRTRRNVSCEGMPSGRSRTVFNQGSLLRPYSAMSSQLSAQAIAAQMAMTRMSVSRRSASPPQRGSSTSPRRSGNRSHANGAPLPPERMPSLDRQQSTRPPARVSARSPLKSHA